MSTVPEGGPAGLRGWLRSKGWWVRFQALRQEGWGNALRRWRVAGRVLATPPVRTRPLADGPEAPCEVHVLVWDRDLLMGLWAAKTFYAAAGVDWPLVWHQGGPLSGKNLGHIRTHFPGSTVLTLDEADRGVDATLGAAGLSRLREARGRAFMLRKLVDPVVFGRADHLLLLDTDVLFFARPAEILDAVAASTPVGLFNRDQKNWYAVGPDIARRLGSELPDRLNAGLALVPRAVLDLATADRWLGAAPELLSEPWLTEQTIEALFAGVNGCRFLPDTYRLSRDPGLTTADGRGLVAKHYVSHPRPLMYREGIPHVLRSGLLGTH